MAEVFCEFRAILFSLKKKCEPAEDYYDDLFTIASEHMIRSRAYPNSVQIKLDI